MNGCALSSYSLIYFRCEVAAGNQFDKQDGINTSGFHIELGTAQVRDTTLILHSAGMTLLFSCHGGSYVEHLLLYCDLIFSLVPGPPGHAGLGCQCLQY